jgi:hypothetical protein
MKVADTATLLALAQDADKDRRNQRMKTGYLQEDLDPDGLHVIEHYFLHDDFEVRCHWLMKVKGSMQPVSGVLDITVGQFNALPDYEEAK